MAAQGALDVAAAAAAAACGPLALPLVALAVLAWLEDRVPGVARAALPLALALLAALAAGAAGLPGGALAGAGALASFGPAVYGWRGLAGALPLAACGAARLAAGDGAALLVGAGVGAAVGLVAVGLAVRLFPDGHLARRRRARVDRRAKLA